MKVQNRQISEQHFEHFIEQILSSRVVWALSYPEGGYAVCPSNEFDDVDVYVFWSDKAEAEKCCEEDWKNLVPTPIELDSFIEEWLPGIDEDGFLVGPNWDSTLYGPEVDPEEVIKALGKE